MIEVDCKARFGYFTSFGVAQNIIIILNSYLV